MFFKAFSDLSNLLIDGYVIAYLVFLVWLVCMNWTYFRKERVRSESGINPDLTLKDHLCEALANFIGGALFGTAIVGFLWFIMYGLLIVPILEHLFGVTSTHLY